MASADNGALLTERHLLIVALYLLGADEIVAHVVFAAVIDECSCHMCSVAATTPTRAVLSCTPPPHTAAMLHSSSMNSMLMGLVSFNRKLQTVKKINQINKNTILFFFVQIIIQSKMQFVEQKSKIYFYFRLHKGRKMFNFTISL